MTDAIEVFTKEHGKELPPLLSPALRERLWELRLKTPEVCDGLLRLGVRKMDDVVAMKSNKLTKCGLPLNECRLLQKHIADIPRFKEGDKVWSKFRSIHGDIYDAEQPEKSISRNEWGAAEIVKVDGDFRSYTIFYLGPEIEVGGQTPFRLKLCEETDGMTYPGNKGGSFRVAARDMPSERRECPMFVHQYRSHFVGLIGNRSHGYECTGIYRRSNPHTQEIPWRRKHGYDLQAS